MQGNYIDLLITDGDFTLNLAAEPGLCADNISVGQDIKHAIVESGIATKLVAERSPTMRADVITQLILLVEDDLRIIPGTVNIKEESAGKLLITAQTYQSGALIFGVAYE